MDSQTALLLGLCVAFPHMFRHVNCHLSFSVVSLLLSFLFFTPHCLSAGSVPCLEVVAAGTVVEASALLPLHLFHLHCQSINLQTIVTGEKKC